MNSVETLYAIWREEDSKKNPINAIAATHTPTRAIQLPNIEEPYNLFCISSAKEAKFKKVFGIFARFLSLTKVRIGFYPLYPRVSRQMLEKYNTEERIISLYFKICVTEVD